MRSGVTAEIPFSDTDPFLSLTAVVPESAYCSHHQRFMKTSVLLDTQQHPRPHPHPGRSRLFLARRLARYHTRQTLPLEPNHPVPPQPPGMSRSRSEQLTYRATRKLQQQQQGSVGTRFPHLRRAPSGGYAYSTDEDSASMESKMILNYVESPLKKTPAFWEAPRPVLERRRESGAYFFIIHPFAAAAGAACFLLCSIKKNAIARFQKQPPPCFVWCGSFSSSMRIDSFNRHHMDERRLFRAWCNMTARVASFFPSFLPS